MKIHKLIKTPYYLYRYIRDFIYLSLTLGIWKKSWRFHSLPLIQKCKNSTIEIGEYFVACSNPKNNTIGVFQKVTLKTCQKGAEIVIGNNVGISGAVISSMDSIYIGNNVLIGSGALITDNDAHPIHPDFRNDESQILISPIIIEDNVFIGARSIILKGVTIGKGSIVGAGAVVSRNVPEYVIVAGNPAKVVGDVRDEKYKIK
jgi:acetyltransferase-like isoleucine patch superfamily enzyme